MPEQPDLSIIIVNWNSAAFVRSCLKSIYANTHGVNFEIVVVDNASYDGCDELVKKEFPEVRFVQNAQNEGFARANNLGFSHSGGRNLLFLNPDTAVVGPALVTMLTFLEATADAGIVGARLLNSDGSVQTSCIQQFPTILNQALDIERLQAAFPKSRLWNIGPLFENANGGVSVDAISGACLMIRRSVFEQVGQFTTDYFMYAEDVDLCWKVKQVGRKNCYVGKATVVHHAGRCSQQKEEQSSSAVMTRDSLAKFLEKTRGRPYAAVYRLAMLVAGVCRTGLLGAFMLMPIRDKSRKSARISFKKWRRVVRWSLGLEPWAAKLAQPRTREAKMVES
ncbi:MAG TPA: glycosyltransferase family 2 protein [Terriglobia bacterium]|nr:glycosyltransferase family 2 protein [Terriglobia bacterium]